MYVRVLEHVIALDALTRLRDKNLNPSDFRKETCRIGFILAAEVTQNLAIDVHEVETPLKRTKGIRLRYRHALISITRAGNGLLEPFLTILPDAYVWHVSISRNEETAEPQYHGSKIPKQIPDNVHTCFVLDPMLATAGSASLAIKLLKESGFRGRIIYVGVLAAPEGVKRLEANHPDIELVVASIDECLNEKFYIVPGLGDFGDRLYPTE